MGSIILKIFKNLFVKKFSNSRFRLLFRTDKLKKFINNKFLSYFKSIYSLRSVKKQSFMKRIESFYLGFSKWLFFYVYFITRSKILARILKRKFLRVLKEMRNFKLENFEKFLIRVSRIKLYHFFNFLRVHLFDYSLINISVKNINLLQLFYKIHFRKNLFILFSQSPYIVKCIIFFPYSVIKNVIDFYGLINKNKFIY